jgi:hypothetical protein
MNNFLTISAYVTISLSMFICGAFLLSGCAGNNIVNMKSNGAQLQDFNGYDQAE